MGIPMPVGTGMFRLQHRAMRLEMSEDGKEAGTGAGAGGANGDGNPALPSSDNDREGDAEDRGGSNESAAAVRVKPGTLNPKP